MKRKYVFDEPPYREHLKIYNLLDPMHIFKNISSYLWRHISLNKSDTLGNMRDLSYSNTKNWLRKESKGEVGPSW